MPNHVQNKLKAIGPKAKVKVAMESIQGEKDKEGFIPRIDFNKILPMPGSLNVESGTLGETAAKVLFGPDSDINAVSFPSIFSGKEDIERFRKWDTATQKKAIELAFVYKENKEKYGYTTWYNWSCNNWGTKWNAYQTPDQRDESDTIFFQTAWSAPLPVIEALSKKFPDLTFEIEWADEDTGSNTGWFRYKNGVVILNCEFENGSIGAYEMAFKLRPGLEEDYKLIDGNYQYSEEND
jgi:hypothetical protein